MKTFIVRGIFFICIILFFAPSKVVCQTWLWGKGSHFGKWAYNIGCEGTVIAVAPDGGIIAGGEFGSAWYAIPSTIFFGTAAITDSGSLTPFLVRYDSTGNVKWVKSFHPVGPYPFGGIQSIVCDQYGSIYIAGSFSADTLIVEGHILTKVVSGSSFLAKFDTSGHLVWLKDITSAGNTLLALDNNNHLYLGACFGTPTYSLDGLSFTNPGGNTVFLCQMDTGGHANWIKISSGNGYTADFGITVDKDGYIYTSGFYNQAAAKFGSVILPLKSTTDVYDKSFFLTKYDSLGDVLWARHAPAKCLYQIATDAHGSVYATGEFNDRTMSVGSYTFLNNGDSGTSDCFLLKYTSNGDLLWAKNFGGKKDDVGYSVVVDSVQTVWMSIGSLSDSLTIGTTQYKKLSDSIFSYYATGSDPLYVVRYDSTGYLQCTATLGSGGDDYSYLAVDKKGYIFVGADFAIDTLPFKVGVSTLSNNGVESMYLAKLEPCSVVYHTNNVPDNNVNEDIKIYPNPVSNQLIIENAAIGSKITIYNIFGQIVLSSVANSGHEYLDMSNFSPGSYIVRLVDSEKIKENRIIVKL